MQRAAEALQSRRQQLDEAERRLARSQAETQELCERLAADQAEFAVQSAAVRQQVAAEHRQAIADIEEKRRVVQQRGEHADQRLAALQQLRGELERIHRETLEVRLATEELWAQLSGVAPPAVLTQSLGRIRAKLAQQYAQANTEAAEQKRALEALRGRRARETGRAEAAIRAMGRRLSGGVPAASVSPGRSRTATPQREDRGPPAMAAMAGGAAQVSDRTRSARVAGQRRIACRGAIVGYALA